MYCLYFTLRTYARKNYATVEINPHRRLLFRRPMIMMMMMMMMMMLMTSARLPLERKRRTSLLQTGKDVTGKAWRILGYSIDDPEGQAGKLIEIVLCSC